MMTDRELLTKVRDLLAEGEHRLARGVYARSIRRRSVAPNSRDAVCWCVMGAIQKVGGFDTDFDVPVSVLTALHRSDPHAVTVWSDETPYPEIIATLARAAELAGGE